VVESSGLVSRPDDASRGLARAAIPRAVGFLGLWLLLSGVDPADLPAAAVAVVAATWASLRLLPPGSWHPRPAALAGLVLRFLRQSVVAGVDVSWRALDPRLPVRPGLVVYPVRLVPGPAQNTFRTLASLIPGSVPVGLVEGGGLLVHCLDVGQPVVSQLATEEALLTQALGIPDGGPRRP
jgi:multicomponent Na+:H+ antiporter subunit E